MLTTPLLAFLIAAAPVPATVPVFPPEKLTNLQEFPENIEVRALLDQMRDFSLGLGVNCSHCHMGEDDAPLATYDFASDDKETKRIARRMLRMVRTINDQHLAGLPTRVDPPVEVRCVTCHRGLPQPRQIADVMEIQISKSGAEAAVAHYRELRAEHFGSAAFDFSEWPLHLYAQSLARQQRTRDALAIAELNATYYPDAAHAQFLLGEMHEATGNREAALNHYRRTLELAPGLEFARRRIEALESAPRR